MKLPLTVTGIVEHGNGDGTKLGFPTANLRLSQNLDLEHGVYAAWIWVLGEKHKSALHYGPRLIFNEKNPLFEVHILDFNKTIYGDEMKVTIVQLLRGTQNFPSLESLIQQMKKDTQEARNILL